MEHRERVRQQQFIDKMVANGYELFEPKSYEDIVTNFRIKLGQINGIEFTDNEFEQILNLYDQGTVFDRSFRLLRKNDIRLDNGEPYAIKLMESTKWCENYFQIAQEVVTNENGSDGKKARFDSVIFINGLPLVIMEFKQSIVGKNKGIEQIIDYQKSGKMHGLFLYCQLFVASSFSTTRYFANNNQISKEFIFPWTDENNQEISSLIDGDKCVYNTLLSRCFIAEMIVRYMIRKENDKVNVVLRPYQVYAVKNILRKVKENSGNGYIFHTTGSGKTITSFKTCKLLTESPEVDKVIFLVDRKDLDAQTKSEYDEFENGCYDDAKNAKQLRKNLLSNSNKIIVGTVQKMIDVIKGLNDEQKHQLLSKRVVIIIDECHRSQSDVTTNLLRSVFENNAQYFGFTGTPIFDDNARVDNLIYKTTKSIFDEELHRYSITDAVRDKNVLQFNISQPKIIENVNQLDVNRIHSISEHVLGNFDNYTDNRMFNTIFATQSKAQLKLYYAALKELNETLPKHEQIKFTCIFSRNADDVEEYVEKNSEDKFVSEVIEDYNNMLNTNIATNDIEAFKDNVYNEVRNKTIDLVLVVNMLLTGFDSPITKTLFVDKNLRYHTLLQAYSRVNRLYEKKLFGNVVCFVDQKEDRDLALELFSSGGISTDFEIEPYEELVTKFNNYLVYTHSLCKDGEQLREQLKEGNLTVLKESMEAIKKLQKQFSFIKVHPQFNSEDINITLREMNDLKDVYREVHAALTDPTNETNDEDAQLVMDFEIGEFIEDHVNLEYLLNLTQDKLYDQPKEQIKEQVRGYDIPLEVRESLLDAIDNYDQSQNKEIIVYLREALERNKQLKYDEYIAKYKVDNPSLFKELAYEQEIGNISHAQASVYIETKNNLSFIEKRRFKKSSFNFVQRISETYNIAI
ncbi:HsdR family type I site-specific deoxyribonuclease [Mollicutes bacterium LVI A0039]|nr:HsdR family type I site-specific deoxyribonuclease [Mollicutes bacterium LVI A0039]